MSPSPKRYRSLKDLLKAKFRTPDEALQRLGINADEMLPTLWKNGMAFDEKPDTLAEPTPKLRAKDILSRNVRRNLDQLSPTMRQAVREHLSKDDLHQPDVHLHVGERDAQDLQSSRSAATHRRNVLTHDQAEEQLDPQVAAAIWEAVSGHFPDHNSREDFKTLLKSLCGVSDFDEQETSETSEATEGEDASYTPPGPPSSGSTPQVGGSMSAPKPFPKDTSRQRGAMDQSLQAALERVTVLTPPNIAYMNGVPYTGTMHGITYRHGATINPPSRRERLLAMDAMASKSTKKDNKQFANNWPEASRIKVI